MRIVSAKLVAFTGPFVLFGAIAACGDTSTTPEPWQSPGSGAASSSGGGSGSGSGSSSSGSGSSSSGSGSSSSGSGSGSSSGSSGGGSGSSGGGSGSSSGSGSGSSSGSSGGPTGGMDAGGGGGGPFDQFQQHNLDDINMYRATMNLPPLVLDQKLSTFAAAGSQELSMDHMPHQHFITAGNDGTLWSSGFTSSAGENQGDPNGWPQASSNPTTNEMTQIDQIQKAMFDEGPGTGEAHGHYENMMSTTFKRVGVGLLEINGMLYLTNDFSD